MKASIFDTPAGSSFRKKPPELLLLAQKHRGADAPCRPESAAIIVLNIYIEVAQGKVHVVQLSFSQLNEEKVSWTLRVARGRTLSCSKKTPWLGVANALWAGDDMKVTQFQVRLRHQNHDRALDVSTVYLLHRPWRLFLPISNSSQRKCALETPLYLKR